MSSPTKQTEIRRAIRRANMGKFRKNKTRCVGSTPNSLPLNVPNANELAMAKKK